MLKELMIVGALLAPHIVEPSRAVTDPNEYTVINATDKEIVFFQGYSDEDVYVGAKTRMTYPYRVQTSDSFMIYLEKETWASKPNDLYYIYSAPDFEDPIPLTFSEATYNYYAEVEAYSPATGLQIGRFESLANVHGWINEEKFGINGNLNASLPYNQLTNLIPTGVSFKYMLNNGTQSTTVNSLYALKVKPSVGSINQVALYANQGQTSIVAYNGYDPNLNPFLLYHGTFTNEVVFQGGYKTVAFGELYGSLPYYFSELPISFISDSQETTQSVWDSLTKSFELVGMVFTAIGTPFAWMILPGVSIGVLLLVPLLIGLFVWLIKFLKKG